MSVRKTKQVSQSHVDCFRAWGLVAGEHAFYAESLGQLYLFLTGAFLDHLGKDDIEDALILNFHVGLNCSGEYDVVTARGLVKRKFTVSLTNPKRNGLVQRIGKLHRKDGRFTLAVCSAAVLAEAFFLAKPEMKEFMFRDYRKRIKDNSVLEVEITRRLAELFKGLRTLKLRVFHTAADLPLTALYLKFCQPVVPHSPSNRGINKSTPVKGAKKVLELLATGLYDPRYATDVVQERSDVNLPVQILVAGDAAVDSAIRKQIKNLVDVYVKHINQHTTLPSSSDFNLQPHTVNFFVAHYGEDAKLARAIKNEIESFAKRKKVNCKCVIGVGPEMSKGGQSFYDNFSELMRMTDYAIVLYPEKPITRHNVLYELGVFSQRFVTRDSTSKQNSSRATLVAKSSKISRELSDWSGIPIVNRPQGREVTVAKAILKSLAQKIPLFRA